MRKFDFDDILIIPEIITTINSRYDNITLPDKLPIFTAPMDTVVDLSNIDDFLENGINVVLPRTVQYDDFKKLYNINPNNYNNVFVSFGFSDIERLLENQLTELHENAHILIDVANGHMQKIIDYCKKIKELRPDIIIMVGNIANPETYMRYALEDCVTLIRIGIGNGGSCTTAKNATIGYSLASLIKEINDIRNFLMNEGYVNLPTIIADGGMKDYADIIKAFNLGADYCMLGGIFNKSIESCANNYLFGIKINKWLTKFLFNHNFPVKKYYRGMSTKAAQKAMGKKDLKTSEGIIRYRKIEYYLAGWIENFVHYLRSAMSYSNCKTLKEFIGKSSYIEITENSYKRFNK